MALSARTRAKIILDLIQDGDVTDESLYDGLDLFDNFTYWFKHCYKAHGPLYDANGAPLLFSRVSSEKHAEFYIKQLVEWHRQAGMKAYVKPTTERFSVMVRDNLSRRLDEDFG